MWKTLFWKDSIDNKAVIIVRDYRLKTIAKQPKFSQKSPQVVKHVVKGEKRACSTLEAGKNKPIMIITKTRDFKRFCKINKEKSGILRLPIFGTSVHNRFTDTA